MKINNHIIFPKYNLKYLWCSFWQQAKLQTSCPKGENSATESLWSSIQTFGKCPLTFVGPKVWSLYILATGGLSRTKCRENQQFEDCNFVYFLCILTSASRSFLCPSNFWHEITLHSLCFVLFISYYLYIFLFLNILWLHQKLPQLSLIHCTFVYIGMLSSPVNLSHLFLCLLIFF